MCQTTPRCRGRHVSQVKSALLVAHGHISGVRRSAAATGGEPTSVLGYFVLFRTGILLPHTRRRSHGYQTAMSKQKEPEYVLITVPTESNRERTWQVLLCRGSPLARKQGLHPPPACDCVTVPLVLVAFRTTAVAFSLRRSVYFSAWQTEPCRVRMSVGAPHGTELGGRYGPVNPRELRY